MRQIVLSFVLAVSCGPALAQDRFEIDPHLIDRCLAINDETPMRCVGRQADACAQRNGGGSDMVISVCMENEAIYWDGLLNIRYAELLDYARDREKQDIGYETEQLTDAVRNIQRAWITYRDATCNHALALAAPFNSAMGPAINECVMHETARQAFDLNNIQAQYRRYQ